VLGFFHFPPVFRSPFSFRTIVVVVVVVVFVVVVVVVRLMTDYSSRFG